MRQAVLAIALVFTTLLGYLTVVDLASQGVTAVGVLAAIIVLLLVIGILGALRNPPDKWVHIRSCRKATFAGEWLRTGDRYRRERVMLVSDLLRAVAIGGAAVAVFARAPAVFAPAPDVFAPAPINGARVSVQVCDAYQQPIAYVWAYDSERPICRSAGVHRLTCRIPKCRLYAGDYDRRFRPVRRRSCTLGRRRSMRRARSCQPDRNRRCVDGLTWPLRQPVPPHRHRSQGP